MEIIKTTEKTFEKDVLEKEKALVYFGAGWCPDCVAVYPKLEEIAKENPDYVMANVNVDEEEGLVEKYQVEFYPTLTRFERGKETDKIIETLPNNEEITIEAIYKLME